MDLSVNLSGVKLKNPIISAAGPNTKNWYIVKKGVDAGCGAIVIRSLHLNSLEEPERYVRDAWHICYKGNKRSYKNDFYSLQSMAAPALRHTSGIDPGWGGGAQVPRLDEWAEEVRRMVQYAHTQDCKIIASIGWCGDGMGNEEVWRKEASAMAYAGVDALELHTSPSPATQGARYIQMDPEYYLHMPIRAAQSAGLPVFPKIGLDCCDVISASKLAQEWGADGVVPVARWMSLNIDTEDPEKLCWRVPGYGGSWAVPILAACTYRMRLEEANIGHLLQSNDAKPKTKPITIPIMPSGGIQNAEDIITYILAGASAVQSCAQILLEGYAAVPRWISGLEGWMRSHSFGTIESFRGMAGIVRKPEELPEWYSCIDAQKCVGCGVCAEACTNAAIAIQDKKARLAPEKCEGCRNCSYVCPVRAIEMKAHSMEMQE